MAKVRVICPDSHGSAIDWRAAKAFLADLKQLGADEVVLLGDHVDAGATFSSHQRNYSDELGESYEEDCEQANAFLDAVQAAAPKAAYYMLEGNHEQHVERWASRMFSHERDANMFVDKMGPSTVMNLKRRGIRYYDRKSCHMGLSVPGTIRLGRCFFTHGITACKNAAAAHLGAFGANVVFGHTHRSQALISKTVTSEAIGAWCPGTLAKLQPLYMHTSPTAWTHGFAVQFVAKSGAFQHVNVSIVSGVSLLASSGLLRSP